jgi:hypothetical protein
MGHAILPQRETIIGPWRIACDRRPQRSGGARVRVTANVKLGKGSVYALDKGAFRPGAGGFEWKARNAVPVLAEVEVGPEDFEASGGRIELWV